MLPAQSSSALGGNGGVATMLDRWYRELLALREQWGALPDVFFVVLAVVVVNFGLRIAFQRWRRRVATTESVWDDAIYYSLSGPVRALVWIVGLSLAVEILEPAPETLLAEIVAPVRTLALVAVLTWFLLRLIVSVEHNLVIHAERKGKELDRTTADAVAKLLRASVSITAALVALQSLGISVSGVLAFGGIGGIAVGFAARDLLANFFGGLTVYLNRPFSVGDWIRSPDRDIEGVVEEVGWRFTTVRRFDMRPLYIPNATFTTVAVENPSRMSHRRIYETVGVRYDDADAVAAIVADVRAMLEAHEFVDTTQTIIVNFDAFGDSSLDFFIYCYTTTTRWAAYHEIKQDVLMRVHEIVQRHGAEVAFPTRTLHWGDTLSLAHAGAGNG